MPMYDLLKYNKNYLWNYYREKIDGADDNSSDAKSFKYKTKIVGKTLERAERPPQAPQNPDGTQPPQPTQPAVPALNAEATLPLKYLSNFWRFFDLLQTNCEIELDLPWTKDCVLIEHYDNITGENFFITTTKLYVPVVTLSRNDNIKFLGNTKQGFKRAISWNKYICA